MLLTKYYSSDQIEKIEIGGACSAYERRVEVYAGFWWRNLRERDHLENPGVDGTIILRWIFRKWDGVDWIDLTQDRTGKCGHEHAGSIKCMEVLD